MSEELSDSLGIDTVISRLVTYDTADFIETDSQLLNYWSDYYYSIINEGIKYPKFLSKYLTLCLNLLRNVDAKSMGPESKTLWKVKGLSPVTRNLCCQSARGNRSGAVRYFPEAVRPRGNTAAPDRFPRADWQHKFLVTGLNPDYNMVTVRV